MKYLIVGLGNIGPEYHETRHNIGFMVADALAKEAGTAFKDGRYGFTTTLSIKGRQLILLKPSTFMNLSGNAVRYWMQKENIPLENVLIVVDDLALPFGTLRLKGKGSDAGHNGLKHIAATLGTQNYARLRFGIGNDFPRGGQVDFVLGHFTDEDWKTMDERLKMAGEIIKSFCLAGIDITMNQFNKKMSEARIDKWMWAVRIFKTRTIAAEACKKGRISINGALAKAARTIKPGDVIQVRKPPVTYSFKVLQTIEKRVGAKLVPEMMENITTPDQYELLEMSKVSGFINRAKGTGRPTKKDRRELEDFTAPEFMDDFDFDFDFEE